MMKKTPRPLCETSHRLCERSEAIHLSGLLRRLVSCTDALKKMLCMTLLCWSTQGWCDETSQALQQKLNAIQTMTASFNQIVRAKHREISRSTGTMALSRPGHFRWQTIKPMEQTVIADGRHLWVYDVDLEQVSVKKQDKGLGSTAALFLSGYQQDTVTHDFNVTRKSDGNQERFDLQSKSGKANFQRVRLTFKNNELTGIELFDQLGQHTDVQLSQIKTNPVLSAALFQFKVPKGVDVVEQ
jgi:outer membrane lipoprotein carrier protein